MKNYRNFNTKFLKLKMDFLNIAYDKFIVYVHKMIIVYLQINTVIIVYVH